MKRLLITALVCFSLPALAFYGSRDSNYNRAISTGATYQGPGDVFSTGIYAWYSTARAYNAAYAAANGNMFKVVDTSTGTASCTVKAAASGYVDLTTAFCPDSAPAVNLVTFCTVTHATGCSITTIYNQAGTGSGCDAVQATLASMPLLILNSTPTGTLPAAQGSGFVGTMQVTSCPAITVVPVAFSTVIERTSGTTSAYLIGGSGNSSIGFGTTGNAEITGGTALDLAAANNSWHSISGLVNGNGTSSAINVDGTDQSGAAGNTALGANNLRLIRVTSLGGTVLFVEGGVWATAMTSTNRNSLCHNQQSATNGYNFGGGSC